MAMEGNKSHFEQGLRTLEEINSLVGPDANDLVQKVLFHLSELHEGLKGFETSLTSLEEVKYCLNEKLDDFLYDSLLHLTNAKNINIYKDFDDLTIQKWDLIYKVLPTFFRVIALMNYEDNIKLDLGAESITIDGRANLKESIVEQREAIYRANRELMKNDCILVYKVVEGLNGPYLQLKLDLTHDNEFCYLIDLEEEKNILLAFSNLFCSYEIEANNKDLTDHVIIKIDNDLNVEKLDNVKSYSGRLIHFPFLFHPISIIIPKQGTVVPLDKIDLLKSTGSCSTQKRQDVGKVSNSNPVHFKYIDFFALIAQS